MNLRSINISAKLFASRVCFAALVALVSVATAARADDDCLNTTTTTAVPDFAPCEVTEPQIDLDAALAEHAVSATISRNSDDTPWIAQGSKGVPLTVNSSDTGVSMRTSLATWRDYNVRDAMKTIDTSTPASPSDIILPSAPAPPKSPLDIWSSLDVQGYQGSGDEAMRAGVGADYKINRATTVGVLAERGDAKAARAGLEQDSKMAAYVTLQATPMLSLDARTEWQAGNADFAANTGAAEMSTFTLAPRINHSFALDGGKTIEPFVTYKRQFDLGAPGGETGMAGLVTDSAGAGLTFTSPDAYSFSVTTDVEGLGATTAESLNSKFQLKIPIE
jgi:hypothetical protein